jgi:hypothetical protein
MFFCLWLPQKLALITSISIDLPCQPTGLNVPPALSLPANIAILEVDILKTQGLFTRPISEHDFAVS